MFHWMCSYNFLNIFNNYLGVMSRLELARLPGCPAAPGLLYFKHFSACCSWSISFPAHLGCSSLSLTTSDLAICALLCSQQAPTSMNSPEKSQAHCQLPSVEAGNCSNIINHKFPACAPYLGLLSSPPPSIPGFLKGSDHLSQTA